MQPFNEEQIQDQKYSKRNISDLTNRFGQFFGTKSTHSQSYQFQKKNNPLIHQNNTINLSKRRNMRKYDSNGKLHLVVVSSTIYAAVQ